MKTISRGPVIIGSLLVIAFLATVVLSNLDKGDGEVRSVSVKGGALLPAQKYAAFIGQSIVNRKKVNAADLRDAVMRHPYVADALVNLTPDGSASVGVYEKKIFARFFKGETEYFVTDNRQIIKKLPDTNCPDVPVISGLSAGASETLTAEDMAKLSDGFKVVCAARYDSVALGPALSEVIVGEQGAMALTISGVKPTVYFDRWNIGRQTVYLGELLKHRERFADALSGAAYIDVRYARKIFIGGENS